MRTGQSPWPMLHTSYNITHFLVILKTYPGLFPRQGQIRQTSWKNLHRHLVLHDVVQLFLVPRHKFLRWSLFFYRLFFAMILPTNSILSSSSLTFSFNIARTACIFFLMSMISSRESVSAFSVLLIFSCAFWSLRIFLTSVFLQTELPVRHDFETSFNAVAISFASVSISSVAIF